MKACCSASGLREIYQIDSNPRSRTLDDIRTLLGYRGTKLRANQELRILVVDLFPSIRALCSPPAAHSSRAGAERFHALLGLAILVVAYLRKTRLEDQMLAQAFGADYNAYRRHTWALVPLLF